MATREKIYFNAKLGHTKAVLGGEKTTEILATRISKRECSDGVIKDAMCAHYSDGYRVGKVKLPFRVGEEYAVMQSYKNIRRKGIERYKLTAGWYNPRSTRADEMPYKITVENIRLTSLEEITEEEWIQCGILKTDRGCYIIDGIEPRKYDTLTGAVRSYLLFMFGYVPEMLFVFNFKVGSNGERESI
jgi:hypothetical protein